MALSPKEIDEYLANMPDEVLTSISFEVPWQFDSSSDGYRDSDGAPVLSRDSKDDSIWTREKLQSECWTKFHRNPFVNSATRGMVGRMTGMGFGTYSDLWEIQEVIDEIELDHRNELYKFWPKYVGRRLIEGELFLMLTVHKDGFVEVDFLDPASLSKTGDKGSGIIFHSRKQTMPLFYILDRGIAKDPQLVPSIYLAYYPELVFDAKNHPDWKLKYTKDSRRSRVKAFQPLGGYYRFIVGYDSGFVTKRAISYLRTILEWLNHYENLKKYEIDHKKSSGAYLWVFKITDARSFKLWLSLDDDEKRKTGIGAKKTPGGTVVLPPGMELEVVNPQLNSITNQDEDIKDFVSSGMNEPADIMTGRSSSPFASVNASRGPMSDRVSDEIHWFSNFLQYDFWGGIFYLRAKLGKMKETFEVDVPIDFASTGEKKVKTKKVKVKPERLIDFSWPTSETIDYETRAKGLLGTKHGPVAEVLGIPPSEVVKRMGFSGAYKRLRLIHALEKERYPELVYTVDAESMQEKAEGEPTKKKTNTENKNA